MTCRGVAGRRSGAVGLALVGAMVLLAAATAPAADAPSPTHSGTAAKRAAAPRPTRTDAACAAIVDAGQERETRIPGHLAIHRVIGAGRANFYSAPDAGCALAGVFVIPGDEVIAYAERDGYTQVMYLNHARGTETTGWLETARLAGTGLGISPQ